MSSKDEIRGFYVDSLPVCQLCTTAKEKARANLENEILEGSSDEDPICCNRCGKIIHRFELPKQLSKQNDPKPSPDSEGLGFWYAGPFAVGFVPEVNGTEAREVSEFVATKHEIIQLAKYWLKRRLENNFAFFLIGMTGSSELRINHYSDRRICRIRDFLSEQEFDDLIADVERKLKNKYKVNDTDWNIYKNGSQEDWDQFQEKLLKKLETDELLEPDSKKEK